MPPEGVGFGGERGSDAGAVRPGEGDVGGELGEYPILGLKAEQFKLKLAKAGANSFVWQVRCTM